MIEERKDFVIGELICFGITKLQDGRQLYEAQLGELEQLYIQQQVKQARKVVMEQVR
ncbi:Fur-regulated basic protein FbpA [Niallia nealsonii]|uniref:Fur-regulated basic protein FbpA n=2 Tax=Niallia nealsonii TaxID=115979 RepID=A0A2N0Z3C2_9BACI|nr:Fur-regulated basic protein FbpA [Niallia nealsonii]